MNTPLDFAFENAYQNFARHSFTLKMACHLLGSENLHTLSQEQIEEVEKILMTSEKMEDFWFKKLLENGIPEELIPESLQNIIND